jgi:hypothetical protein
MMKLCMAFVVTVALCGLAAQATTPSLGGQWTVVPAKSSTYVPVAGSPGLTLKVQQNDREVVLTMGRTDETRYPIGEKVLFVKNGRPVTAFAEWQGGRFVVSGERARADGKMIAYRLFLSLDSEGDLVMERQESTEASQAVSKIVFSRVAKDQ